MVGMTMWINDDYFILILQVPLKVEQVPILENHSRAEKEFSQPRSQGFRLGRSRDYPKNGSIWHLLVKEWRDIL
jgi:hypothetical protein